MANTRPYEVSFYAHIPHEGDEPLVTMVVDAEGAVHAQWIAGGKAKLADIKHPYVVARPLTHSTQGVAT